MGTFNYHESIFNSRLSFLPLIEALRKNVSEGKPGAKALYSELLKKAENTPGLLEPFTELEFSTEQRDVIEALLATLFPPSSSENANLYAVTVPFRFKAIFSSRLFTDLFLKDGGHDIVMPDDSISKSVNHQKLEFAYWHILAKHYGYDSPEHPIVVYPFHDPVRKVTRFLELKPDTRFVDVKPLGELPPLPENIFSKKTWRRMPLDELMEKLPLDKFVFEGVVIIRINDVTEQEVISEIKNNLLSIHDFGDAKLQGHLQSIMQSLLGTSEIRIGVTPLFQVNEHFVFTALHNCNSLILKSTDGGREKKQISQSLKDLVMNYDEPVIYEQLDKKNIIEAEALRAYFDMGVRSLILCPLRENGELLGLLEIMSDIPNKLTNLHIQKIEKVIPLFVVAIQKIQEGLDTRIDKVIKENFTAIQPAVEWKFTEAAFSYIVKKEEKIQQVSFNDVYPLYGTIDIRNSSVQRMQAIQLDLIEQLHLAQELVKTALQEVSFPLLESIAFKTQRYIDSITDILLSEDELQVYDFLQIQVAEIFHHLADTKPSLKDPVNRYFASIDKQKNLIYHHRHDFEESIGLLNDALATFIDQEQVAAQQVYPHYFDRYVTDGVDFNIYIGQSIAPSRKFEGLYLRNLKIWQLEVLAKAAIIVDKLKTKLPLELSTTQLILAHSIPISITFRTSERKFDVEGAYNSRYEVIKKRIDKVRIKNSKERLTQAGKIAIVYSLPREAAEYEEYIDFLQTRMLLKGEVEKLELEELQGVIGLKALRVGINFEDTPGTSQIELSSLTSKHLLGY